MQLSLSADYSCRTLMYLALRPPDVRSSVDDIAKAYGISAHHLVKVVHRLGQLGYIETTRGRGGGVRLAHEPSCIVIGDVIRKTEPTLALVECFKAEGNTCPITAACGLKLWLGKAVDAFFAVLDDVTLADVIAKRSPLATALGLSGSAFIDRPDSSQNRGGKQRKSSPA